jgi:hypothetical protein
VSTQPLDVRLVAAVDKWFDKNCMYLHGQKDSYMMHELKDALKAECKLEHLRQHLWII